MTGWPLIITFIVAIVAMIYMISKLKIHAFLSLMIVSLAFGLLAGIPLVDTTVAGKTTPGIATVIGAGFSGTFTSIGIVIILGALIGNLLESTGAAIKLADTVVKIVGQKRPVLAIQIMGWIVSIPVFCDSGFVILNPIRRAMVQRTLASSVAMTVALSTGLYAAHVFIPPTPGPIAAAGALGLANNLLLVMGLGALISVPALIGAYFYAVYIGGKEKASDEADRAGVVKSYEELVAAYGELPSAFMSFAPIVAPILLMALGSIAAMAKATGVFADLLKFLGTPIIALGVGTLFGFLQIQKAKMTDKFHEITNESLKVVGPILFITAAGGVLGRVIAVSDIVPFIKANVSTMQVMGIFFPFALSAILKTAQGSSTVALITTAAILNPLMATLGLDSEFARALTVMAIAAGAMTVSHANDSYFWVVTNFGGMT
ncbi:MAG: GntP family permease, partial [Candidatus Accumulibacter sp.]|nr:GntP family permease [Accumulibacter sp.]